ncbi:hypothetical protein C8J56DRAFT_940229 [Mycena floridula]|nr:hypothetical protein C8J56DRAFT_940229 [Mycena floridula]
MALFDININQIANSSRARSFLTSRLMLLESFFSLFFARQSKYFGSWVPFCLPIFAALGLTVIFQ